MPLRSPVPQETVYDSYAANLFIDRDVARSTIVGSISSRTPHFGWLPLDAPVLPSTMFSMVARSHNFISALWEDAELLLRRLGQEQSGCPRRKRANPLREKWILEP